MSFKVDWNLLETESMTEWTKQLLTETLNSGKRPNILASDIEIKDLKFGKIPPNFEILEIGELDKDRFRGIFKIHYQGDSHITLHTKVQANPLKIYGDNLTELENYIGGSSDFIKPNFLLSDDEFSLPLDLKLSDIKLSGIGIIVFSKTKGLTLVFRNDPLDSIKVSSTFDMVQVLANFLQKQIESQIRELFRETLPTVLHRLSLKYISADHEGVFNNLNHLNKNSNNGHNGNINNEIILFDLNNEFNNYSVKNLQKNLKLFNSRETLNLNIPKFKNIIQRSNLDKFNKNLSPNLLTSLNLLNNDTTNILDNSSSNGIPINLLTQKDFEKVEGVIRNISNIQANNYYQKNNNSNVTAIKPKRRTIKLNRNKYKKSTAESASEEEHPRVKGASTVDNTAQELEAVPSDASSTTVITKETSSNSTLSSEEDQNSSDVSSANSSANSSGDENTLVDEKDEIQHPRPSKPIHSHSHFHRNFNSDSPNQNSNSSVLSGVGIGNNYFNFTNKEHYEPQEFEKQKQSDDSANDPEEKFTYLDIKTIKDRLNELKQLEINNHKHFYTDLPPPYQI